MDVDVLKYNSSTGKWEDEPDAGATTLTELTDTTIANPPTDGDVLTYQFATQKWINSPPSGGSASYVYYSIVNSVFPANTSIQVFGQNVTIYGGANVSSVSLISSNNSSWFNGFVPTTGAFSFNTQGVYRLKFEIELVKSNTPPGPPSYGNFLVLEQSTSPNSTLALRRVFTYAVGHYQSNGYDTLMSPQLRLEHILVVNAALVNQPFIAWVDANGAQYYINGYVNSSMGIIEKIG